MQHLIEKNVQNRQFKIVIIYLFISWKISFYILMCFPLRLLDLCPNVVLGQGRSWVDSGSTLGFSATLCAASSRLRRWSLSSNWSRFDETVSARIYG
jgi:hypothetical protein